MNKILGKQMQILFAFIMIAAATGLSSCEKYSFNPPAVDPNAEWKLSTDIQPIFNSNCITCHTGARYPDLTQGKSYQSLTKGNYVTLPAESSKLYTKLNDSNHSAKTTAAEKLKILYWITQGAKNN
jgi:mono/diheme cytochrome c family protein